MKPDIACLLLPLPLKLKGNNNFQTFCTYVSDVIKQNESELAHTDFKI